MTNYRSSANDQLIDGWLAHRMALLAIPGERGENDGCTSPFQRQTTTNNERSAGDQLIDELLAHLMERLALDDNGAEHNCICFSLEPLLRCIAANTEAQLTEMQGIDGEQEQSERIILDPELLRRCTLVQARVVVRVDPAIYSDLTDGSNYSDDAPSVETVVDGDPVYDGDGEEVDDEEPEDSHPEDAEVEDAEPDDEESEDEKFEDKEAGDAEPEDDEPEGAEADGEKSDDHAASNPSKCKCGRYHVTLDSEEESNDDLPPDPNDQQKSGMYYEEF